MPHYLKIFFASLILLTMSYQAFEQGPTAEQKKVLFNKIDTLITNYINFSSFLDKGKNALTPEVLSNFKALFVSDDVSIADDMDPVYFDKGATKPQFPSYATLDRQAAQLNGLPAYTDDYANSLSKLKDYQNGLDVYIKKFYDQRPDFLQAYEEFNKGVRDYRTSFIKQENIRSRSLTDYLAMIQENYPEGLTVRLLNSGVSFKNIANGEVSVIIAKRTTGTVKVSALKLENVDTVIVTLKTSHYYSKVSISSIEVSGYHFNFINDKDRDFIIDSKDACPDEKGFQSNGCPFPEEKGYAAKMKGYLDVREKDSAAMMTARQNTTEKMTVLQARITDLTTKVKDPAHWWITLGVNGGVVSGTPTSAGLGYNNIISALTINPNASFSSGSSFGGDLAVERYFGKKAETGISLGISYQSLSGTLQKNSFSVQYQASDKSGATYRQIITATSPLQEKESVTNISIPVLFLYKTSSEKKLSFKLEIGAAYDVQYKSNMSGTPTGLFDYEAIYAYSKTTPTKPATLFDNSMTPLTTSWVITKAQATRTVGANNVAAYFSALQSAGYPVALGVSAASMSQQKSASFGQGFSLIVRPSVAYNFSRGSYLSLGLFYSYSNLSQSGNSYRLVDEHNNYNTLMQSISKLSTSNFGIRLSYSHSLFYNVPKWTKELSGLQ